jgi:NADH-quinone oxidoreductase subunit J
MFDRAITLGVPLKTLAVLPLNPVVLMALCLVAGVGTVLMLPSRLESPIRKIGGAVVLGVGLIFAALLVRLTAGSADANRGGMGPYFWIFSAIAVVAAVRVITHTRPVYSALYFVLTVMASAGLFILVGAEFMAAALVLIYAGAILVTYVFVIMLAAQTSSSNSPVAGVAEYDAVSREPILASAVGFALAGVLMFVIFDRADGLTKAPANVQAAGSARELGSYLFQSQVLTLEIAGIILTLSMVGAIIIARRRVVGGTVTETEPAEQITTPATPISDDPHSIPVYGTDNPRAKAYPET